MGAFPSFKEAPVTASPLPQLKIPYETRYYMYRHIDLVSRHQIAAQNEFESQLLPVVLNEDTPLQIQSRAHKAHFTESMLFAE